ncbi:MAG: MarR family transcriptional regulator [Eubacteriales bacterium]|nr:MarR family transcriptional regulator [Eubacteriales bacterium]
MRPEQYDSLKLENQLCFPLYACAKEVVRQYQPFLAALDLTYTQYLVMLVLWEEKSLLVRDLGRKLFLDSGTLTPVLKTLEKKGLIDRCRLETDERNLVAALTEKGEDLRAQALAVPPQVAACIPLDAGDAGELYRILHKMMDAFAAE